MHAGNLDQPGPPRRERFGEGSEAWMVTRYDDVRSVLGDARLTPVRNRRRLRRAVLPEFTGKQVQRFRPYIEKHALELTGAFRARGKAELVSEYALPLAMAGMCAYVGIPLEDGPRFHPWVEDVHSLDERRMRAAAQALDAYIREIVAGLESAERAKSAKSAGGEPASDSALGRMVARGAVGHDDLVTMGRSLLVGGYDSTKSLIASAALLLAAHPERRESLLRDPSAIAAFVEETLAESPPFPMLQERLAGEDLELGGVAISQGDAVVVDVAAANRDPARGRRQQVSFGPGLDHCPGSGLARLEAEVAVRTLLEELPGLRLDHASFELRWSVGIVAGPREVPVLFP